MSHAYSPTAKGMAGAGEAALPQDTLSIVGNPAGLTKIGQRLDLGLAWFSPSREYTGVNPFKGDGAMAPLGSGNGTGKVESRNNDFVVPNFGYSYQIDNKSAVGIGVFGNGGMNTDYRANETLRGWGTYGGNTQMQNYQQALGGGNTGVNLTQLGIALGYARNVLDNLSLGGSFLVGYQSIEVRGVGNFQGFTETFTQDPPLRDSSLPVSDAVPRLSPGISHLT